MSSSHKPIPVVVYQDVLCAWSYLADLRLEPVRDRFGTALEWKFRPYPLRVKDVLPSAAEVRLAEKEIARARKEPDAAAKRLVADLWQGLRAPSSSLTALAALEAARLQGESRRGQLLRLMQRAALEMGVNVTRTDVIYELASTVGLKMDPFAAAFESENTRRLIRQEHKLASARGVQGVPTIVVANRWMMSGLRTEQEYSEQLLACMSKLLATPERDPESHVH